MNKKVLSVFLAVCMLVAALPTAVFAKKTATDEIDEAIKAVKTSAADVVVFNDMTMDEFLKAAARCSLRATPAHFLLKKNPIIVYGTLRAKRQAAYLQTYSLQAATKHPTP